MLLVYIPTAGRRQIPPRSPPPIAGRPAFPRRTRSLASSRSISLGRAEPPSLIAQRATVCAWRVPDLFLTNPKLHLYCRHAQAFPGWLNETDE